LANLIGMFLLLSSPDYEYFRAGEIVAAVGNSFLIQFDGGDPPPPMELVSIDTLSNVCPDCNVPRALFFKSRAHLERWSDLMNEPDPATQHGSKVVALKPH
jgi:hypothetical protein